MANPGAARSRIAGDSAGAVSLWFGVFGPPLLWAARFGSSYLLVPYACAAGSMLVLHVVALLALAGTAAAGVIAWRQRRAAGAEGSSGGGGGGAAHRFMATTGLLGSGFFFLVIAAESLANLFVHPCQQAGMPVV